MDPFASLQHPFRLRWMFDYQRFFKQLLLKETVSQQLPKIAFKKQIKFKQNKHATIINKLLIDQLLVRI